MYAFPLEQALYRRVRDCEPQLLARSSGFSDDWLSTAERLCQDFGLPPREDVSPILSTEPGTDSCLFAQPIPRNQVAIVRVTNAVHNTDDPSGLRFHFLVLHRADYDSLGCDPFELAARFSPTWQVEGAMPTLTSASTPPPPRTVAQVQHVLKRSNGPSLLGGSQVLVDGGRLVFERSAPDAELVRDLWTLLPTSTRGELWPATFAFSNALRFHIVVVAKAEGEEFAGYATEEQAADYPQGRYELDLQIAAEAGDQPTLDALFARRSQKQTLRLAIMLLAGMMALALAMKALSPSKPPPAQKPAPVEAPRSDRPESKQ